MKDMPHNTQTKHRYSIYRAVASALRSQQAPYVPDGLEGEVSQELARRYDKPARGFYVPLDAPLERRSDTTTTGSGAAQTVWAPMFIDVYRAKLVVQALGGQITTLSSERGAVQVPTQTTATGTAWVAEGSNAGSYSSLAVSSVTFTPHTILANTGISRFLEEKAAPGFDNWLYSDLGKSITVAIDAAAINGTGPTNNQPVGLLQYPGVSVYELAGDSGNGAAPTYADICAMEKATTVANADSRADARMAWLTSPAGRSKLRRTDCTGSTSGQFIWAKDFNTVLGYPAMATTNVPANLAEGSGSSLTSLIFGDWSNLVVNLFPGADILVNPYTITTQGYYQIYAYQEVDVQVLRSAGFSIANGLVTT